MRAFLDLLEESACIVGDTGELVNLNAAALSKLGYKAEAVQLETLAIKIEKATDKIHIKNHKGAWQTGMLTLRETVVEDKVCHLGKIKWEIEVQEARKQAVLQAFVENLTYEVAIKDGIGSYYYGNKKYREHIQVSEEEIGSVTDECIWTKELQQMIEESDAHVFATKKI